MASKDRLAQSSAGSKKLSPAEYRGGGRVLFNVPAHGFRHSDFFDDEGDPPTNLREQFRKVWRPFLRTHDVTKIAAELSKAGSEVAWPESEWRSRRWPRRALSGGWGPSPFTYADRRVDHEGRSTDAGP